MTEKTSSLIVASLAAVFTSYAWASPGDTLGEFTAPSGHVHGMAFGDSLLWLADHVDNVLVAVDPVSGKVERTLKAPGSRSQDLAFGEGKLWVLDRDGPAIFRVDPKTGAVDRKLHAPVTRASGLAWNQGRLLLLEQGRKPMIRRLDPDDGTTVDAVPAPSTYGNCMTFGGGYVWVADRVADKLFMVEPSSGTVVLVLDAPGPYTSGIEFMDDKLATADYQLDRVFFLALDDGTHVARYGHKDEQATFFMSIQNNGPSKVTSADLYVAVPSNLASQELLEGPVFEPKPSRIEKDEYGQAVAVFHVRNLEPGKRKSVTMRVKARLFDVEYYVFPERVLGTAAIPGDIKRLYLADGAKYDIHSATIKEIARKVVGKETNPYWKARRLAEYVQSHMKYELAGGWNTAPRVLDRGSGSCSEYTFAFVALCRAAGVPARYMGSMVVRRDDASRDEVFHRWAEIYLPPYGWVPFDVQHGDKPTKAQQADGFGRLPAVFLITTRGGGGSRLLGWTYNADAKYECDGPCDVKIDYFTEWEPTAENPGTYERSPRTPVPVAR